jgi:hypothetical protein
MRGPSPWLAPIERTIAQLTKAAAPTAAADVAARVAELRQRLLRDENRDDESGGRGGTG